MLIMQFGSETTYREILEGHLNYWKEQLQGAPAVLELPTDRTRPAVQSFQGGIHAFHVPRAVLDGLKVVSRREGATLFMTLLAAFQTLLDVIRDKKDIEGADPYRQSNSIGIGGVDRIFCKYTCSPCRLVWGSEFPRTGGADGER